VEGKKVIVECEGRAYPESAKDAERIPAPEGVPVCRFSVSEIEADVDKCIRTIQETAHYRALPAYKMDDDLDPSQQAAAATVS
jgi:very-short-patch-repair endonuclease